jgi:hypothetical protein
MLWQSHCTLLSEHIPSYSRLNIFTRGFEPSSKSQGAATGANAAPVASSSNSDSKVEEPQKEDKGERRRKKEERKQEKKARKELKKLGKSGKNDLPRRNHSRSRSPQFRSREHRLGDEQRPRIPSRSRERRTRHDLGSDYNSFERERERENDRRRWDLNNARRDPQNGRNAQS